MYIPGCPIASDGTSMICFVRQATSFSQHQQNDRAANSGVARSSHFIGLADISNSIFSMKYNGVELTFAIMDNSKIDCPSRGVRRVAIDSMNSFSLVNDETGQILVEVDCTRHNLLATNASLDGDLVLLNESNAAEPWSSISVQRIHNSSEIISFILEMVPPENRTDFCTKVDEMGWNSLSWLCYMDDEERVTSMMNKLSLKQ